MQTFESAAMSVARIFVAAFLFNLPAINAQEFDAATSPEPRPEGFVAKVESGLVFINGKFVAAPYRIEADSLSITVNNISWNPPRSTREDVDAGVGPDEPEATNVRRESWRTHRSQLGHGGRRNDPERRGKGRAAQNGERSTNPINRAKSLQRKLESDEIVLLFDGLSGAIVFGAVSELTFCETLIASDPKEEEIDEFAALAAEEPERDKLRTMARQLVRDEELLFVLNERVDEILALEAQNRREVAAVARLSTFAYPLTLAGMLLGVFAFGHMLQWSGKGITSTPGSDESSETARCVTIAVLLMCGMSVLDLIWTILAGEAGTMREVNPLAAVYINSPVQLAAFKVIATAVGLSILYAWRQRQQMQQATWWMCLICVLLTFRWVMFDSMLS